MVDRYVLSDDGKYYSCFFANGNYFLIDKADYDFVSQYTWHQGKRGYPITMSIKRTALTLHRLLLDFPVGDVDHISGDKLDNRRTNLRICTHQQNMFNQKTRNTNTSGYTGVSFLRCAKKYEAYIHCDGKKHYLGLHASAEKAAQARDQAALKLFGEYAKLNSPPGSGCAYG